MTVVYFFTRRRREIKQFLGGRELRKFIRQLNE